MAESVRAAACGGREAAASADCTVRLAAQREKNSTTAGRRRKHGVGVDAGLHGRAPRGIEPAIRDGGEISLVLGGQAGSRIWHGWH